MVQSDSDVTLTRVRVGPFSSHLSWNSLAEKPSRDPRYNMIQTCELVPYLWCIITTRAVLFDAHHSLMVDWNWSCPSNNMESGKKERELRGFSCSLPEVFGAIPGTAAWRYLQHISSNNVRRRFTSEYLDRGRLSIHCRCSCFISSKLDTCTCCSQPVQLVTIMAGGVMPKSLLSEWWLAVIARLANCNQEQHENHLWNQSRYNPELAY